MEEQEQAAQDQSGSDVDQTCQSCEQSDEEKPNVGVVMAFYPILFKRNENPASVSQFYAVKALEFNTCHLLADGRGEAIIALRLVDADMLEIATRAVHHNAGKVVLELSDTKVGQLSYKGQDGAVVEVPVADFVSGVLEQVVFKISTQIGLAEVTVCIKDTCSCYEYFPDVSIPSQPEWSGWRNKLEVGSRVLAATTSGYDALKYQWYLRRFGFYGHNVRSVPELGIQNRWTSIDSVVLDGLFGARTGRCTRDFTCMARGAFRNQANTIVAITYAQSATEHAGEDVVAEACVWFDSGYQVEGYHGDVWLNDLNSNLNNVHAEILYGALVDGDQPQGYVGVSGTVGDSVVHYGNHQFVLADSIRSKIRMFLKDSAREALVYRLHDADINDILLGNTYVNAGLRDMVVAMLRAARRAQGGAYTFADNRDVVVWSTYRSVGEQNALYARGGVTNAQGGHSWHNFGLAADVIFYAANGAPSWGKWDWQALGQLGTAQGLTWGGNWTSFQDRPHYQRPTAGSPNNAVRNTYNNTNGTEEQKLQAVWTLLNMNP